MKSSFRSDFKRDGDTFNSLERSAKPNSLESEYNTGTQNIINSEPNISTRKNKSKRKSKDQLKILEDALKN